VISDNVAAVRQVLSNLPEGEPDAVRAERLRARCRTQLERRTPAGTTWLEPAIVGGCCLVYLSGIVFVVLRVEGIL
jgi:hypothetical protein